MGPQSFGMAVREFRYRRGLTQAQLADRAEMHRSYLSSLERGAYTEAMRHLVEACRVLGLEIVIRPKDGVV